MDACVYLLGLCRTLTRLRSSLMMRDRRQIARDSWSSINNGMVEVFRLIYTQAFKEMTSNLLTEASRGLKYHSRCLAYVFTLKFTISCDRPYKNADIIKITPSLQYFTMQHLSSRPRSPHPHQPVFHNPNVVPE